MRKADLSVASKAVKTVAYWVSNLADSMVSQTVANSAALKDATRVANSDPPMVDHWVVHLELRKADR